ncbi:MAG: SH3 domain-containing protein, partial [Lachnospiraceae bacterium]|nr:SH3 domain-containing protein [Lachnospiraceae bacterium]
MKKRRLAWMLSSCLTAGLIANVQVLPVLAAEEEASLIGQMAFAQCEEYINIRDEASTDGEITAKIYNNGSAVIEEEAGDWYKIRSGNAEGYVKAEYFATGEEAEEIAERVAYRVATVYPDELNIRANPDEGSGVIGSAGKDQELEVVAWDGDWMKVALSADEFGYVNAYYVDYRTYYPVAETLEEERARLLAEQNAAETSEYEEP